MPEQNKAMAKLELGNLFGLNVLRHTRDPKAKRKAWIMAGVWAFLIVVLCCYVGGLSYGLILLGASEVIPAYLIAIASLVLFFFGIFKAGSVLFRRNGYEILCSLPVPKSAVVISRFLSIYTEDLAVAAAVALPGLAVYAWFLRPQVSFYLAGALAILAVPLLPNAAAALIGAVVTGISSRMKHKSLVEAGLSIVVVFTVLLGTSQLASIDGDITAEMLKAVSDVVFGTLQKLYPPAVWLGQTVVRGEILSCLALGVGCLAVLGAVAALVTLRFHRICRRLFATSARHDYRMEKLKQDSLLLSLCKRELKRYFSSGVYVSNTIMGPIMGTVLSAGLFFGGADRLTGLLPAAIDLLNPAPFGLAAVFCLMTTSSVSISIEGTNWWIVKSLPLTTKSILDAKLLLNLSLMAPFYLLSEVLLALALKPGPAELVWLLAIPAVLILFSCVFGITVNLRLPVMNWESEVSVVKQSASSMLGGMAGFLLGILCAIPAVLGVYNNWTKTGLCLLLLGITALLYRRNQNVDLRQI